MNPSSEDAQIEEALKDPAICRRAYHFFREEHQRRLMSNADLSKGLADIIDTGALSEEHIALLAEAMRRLDPRNSQEDNRMRLHTKGMLFGVAAIVGLALLAMWLNKVGYAFGLGAMAALLQVAVMKRYE